MSTIEATSVTRTYGTGDGAFTAVKEVSLTVRQGELVALLGTNGAGKTSLTEILQGTATASSGTVRVFGADPVAQRNLVRPRTGIMLQEAGFADDLTVRESVTMWRGMMAHGMSVDEVLEIVKLTHRANVRIKALSSGEKRRLDLAMATVGRPELLFLDEPTTGLDPASRRNTWELITAMLNTGTTIFLTTHYLEEAETLADRVLIMSQGQIITEGTVPSIVATQPSTISFSDPTGSLDNAELNALPALESPATTERERTVLRSTDVQATLSALLTLANGRGVRLENLDARSASLEHAFLALTA